MRKIIIIIIIAFALMGLSGMAQPAIQWQKSLGGTNDDNSTCIIQTLDGGYLIGGHSSSQNGEVTGPYNGSAWIVKLFPNGSIQWQKNYGGNNDDDPECLLQTSDGGYIISGSTTSDTFEGIYNYRTLGAFVLKLTDSGVVQWANCYGSTYLGWNYANSIIQTPDGGFIFCGSTSADDSSYIDYHGGWDMVVVKISDSGDFQWGKCYGGSGDEGESSTIMYKTNDGGYILACDASSIDGDLLGDNNHGNGDYWVVKIDSMGNIKWQNCYGGGGWDVPYSIIQTLDQGYIVTGFTGSNDGDVIGNHGSYDYWVVKLSDTGAIQWAKCYGGSDDDEGCSIIQNPDSTYVVSGFALSTDGNVTNNHGGQDDWVVKLNTSGQIIWVQSYGGSNDEVAYSIIRTTDGGYAMEGFSDSNNDEVTGNHGEADFWVVKVAPDTMTGIIEVKPQGGVSLYPNPTTSLLTLSLPNTTQKAIINLYDMLGEKVQPQLITNNSSFLIDLSNLSQGIYFLEVIMDGGKQVRKVVKM